MSRLKNYLPYDILLTIYNSLIMPHIQYGILCWGHKSERIMKLQKRAMRLITRSKYNSHTEPLYKELKCLKASDIYSQNMLKFYFKHENSKLPHYFTHMSFTIDPQHSHNTRFKHSINLPKPDTKTGGKCLRYILPKTLQKTPSCIKDKVKTHSPQGFSNYIKQYYISNYREHCVIENCYICIRNRSPSPSQHRSSFLFISSIQK